MVNIVFNMSYFCTKDSHGQLGLLYVLHVLRTSWSIRSFAYPIHIKDSHDLLGFVYVLFVLRKVIVN